MAAREGLSRSCVANRDGVGSWSDTPLKDTRPRLRNLGEENITLFWKLEDACGNLEFSSRFTCSPLQPLQRVVATRTVPCHSALLLTCITRHRWTKRKK